MASHRESRQDGQASVELVAVLPALVVCVLIAGHALAAGWALWSAAGAARAGARAELLGEDGEAAARRALPPALREDARFESEDGIRVEVRTPALLPGGQGPRLAAAAQLDPGDG
jgi:hypothetical protein